MSYNSVCMEELDKKQNIKYNNTLKNYYNLTIEHD